LLARAKAVNIEMIFETIRYDTIKYIYVRPKADEQPA